MKNKVLMINLSTIQISGNKSHFLSTPFAFAIKTIIFASENCVNTQ